MQRQYNLRNPAVKRLMKEAQELREPTEQYHAQPLEDNLFEWHFTIRGPGESEFDGGIYHGRIVLPPEYPMKPPSIILLTPNGRFEVFKKICLSISGYHPESWQPSWSIRTALLAIIGFMPTHGAGAIGSLDYSADERKVLAKKSQAWNCPTCGDLSNELKPVTEASKETNREAKELASQISFQAEKEKKGSETGDAAQSTAANSPPSDGTPNVSTPEPSNAGATTSVQASPGPSPAGQFHPGGSMPRLPFPFPFMPPPGMVAPPGTIPTTGAGDPRNATGAPRFGQTFPLPFVGSTFPPMFPPPPYMTGQQRMPVHNPFMPWTQHFPHSQAMRAPGTNLTTVSATGTVPSPGTLTQTAGARPLQNTPGSSPTRTSANNATPSSETPGLATGDTPVSTDRAASSSVTTPLSATPSTSVIAPAGVSAPASVTTPVNGTPPAGATPPATSSNSLNSGSMTAPSTSQASSTIPQAPPQTEGLRQRNPPRLSPGTVGQSAELPRQQPRSGGTFSLVLIVVLGLVIGLLLLRRLYHMNLLPM